MQIEYKHLLFALFMCCAPLPLNLQPDKTNDNAFKARKYF